MTLQIDHYYMKIHDEYNLTLHGYIQQVQQRGILQSNNKINAQS